MIFESDGLALCKIKGSVVPQALLLTLPSLLLTVALYVVNQEVEGGLQSIRIGDVSVTQAWSAMTLLLGMLTGFRTQQSLDRYWEGTSLLHRMRGEWFDAISCLMTFSRASRPTMSDEVWQFRHTLVRLVSFMHGSALDEISGLDAGHVPFQTIDTDGLDDNILHFSEVAVGENGWNRVCLLHHSIQVLVTHNMHAGVLDISPPILSRVYQTMSRGLVDLMNAIKIRDTSFPFPWAQIITLSLVVYAICTPVMMIVSVTSLVWAIPAVCFPTFGMMALNLISAQLEMPFGVDDNDLPLGHFQREMNRSLLLLLHEGADLLPSTRARAPTDVMNILMSMAHCRWSHFSRCTSRSLDEMDMDRSLSAESKLTEPKLTQPPHSIDRAAAQMVRLSSDSAPSPSAAPSKSTSDGLAQDLALIMGSSRQILSLTESLGTSWREHEETLLRLMATLPQLESALLKTKQPLQQI